MNFVKNFTEQLSRNFSRGRNYEYELTFAPYDLEVIISTASPKTGVGFGFAFPKGSSLPELFSTKILNLIEDGTIATTHRRWFAIRSQCSDRKKLAANVEAIVFKDIQGVFFIFGSGIGVAFIIFCNASVLGMLWATLFDLFFNCITKPNYSFCEFLADSATGQKQNCCSFGFHFASWLF